MDMHPPVVEAENVCMPHRRYAGKSTFDPHSFDDTRVGVPQYIMTAAWSDELATLARRRKPSTLYPVSGENRGLKNRPTTIMKVICPVHAPNSAKNGTRPLRGSSFSVENHLELALVRRCRPRIVRNS